MRRLFAMTIFLIALAAGAYTQRVAVKDWVLEQSAPALPEAVPAHVILSEAKDPRDDEDMRTRDPSVDEILPQDDNDLESLPQDDNELELPPQDDNDLEPLAPFDDDLPISMNLAVPFTSQAPHGNWDEPYKEACEEASVYMVHAYYEGVPEGRIAQEQADEDLLNIVAFEGALFGFYEDTTAEKTGVFAELMFGHRFELIENPSVEDIKQQLAAGRPVIVPAAGRLLGNPFFTAPGPVYHMLVIRGYTQDGRFIVNDPGTYRGEGYLYDFDTIMNAMHDWNQGEEIVQGRKVVLVLTP